MQRKNLMPLMLILAGLLLSNGDSQQSPSIWPVGPSKVCVLVLEADQAYRTYLPQTMVDSWFAEKSRRHSNIEQFAVLGAIDDAAKQSPWVDLIRDNPPVRYPAIYICRSDGKRGAAGDPPASTAELVSVIERLGR